MVLYFVWKQLSLNKLQNLGVYLFIPGQSAQLQIKINAHCEDEVDFFDFCCCCAVVLERLITYIDDSIISIIFLKINLRPEGEFGSRLTTV